MHRSCVTIDCDLLRRLYVDEALTFQEIGVALGCGATTVARRLEQAGVPARPRGPRVSGGRFLIPSSSAAWSCEFCYSVGLIATDGSMSWDGRHMSVSRNAAGQL